jgi:hypothetical protein
VNVSLLEEVWYTRERELANICRIVEQKLLFEVHSLQVQFDYEVRNIDAILGCGKCIGRNIRVTQNLCIYNKRVVDIFLQRIG